METDFSRIKMPFNGEWKGEGFAKFLTIDDTAYTETWRFTPDDDKDPSISIKRPYIKTVREKRPYRFLGHRVRTRKRRQGIAGECTGRRRPDRDL